MYRAARGMTLATEVVAQLMTIPIAKILVTLSVALLAAACGPRAQVPAQAEWAAVDVKDEAAYPLGAYGGLQHNLRVNSSDGRTLRVRGKIHNPYPGAVDGVRIVVQILSSGPPEGRELERHQIELSAVDLAAGSETVVHRDIQTMYTSSKVIRVATFAMKREGSDMPLPPADLAGAPAVQLGTAGVPIPESMAGSIFSGL